MHCQTILRYQNCQFIYLDFDIENIICQNIRILFVLTIIPLAEIPNRFISFVLRLYKLLYVERKRILLKIVEEFVSFKKYISLPFCFLSFLNNDILNNEYINKGMRASFSYCKRTVSNRKA